MSQILAISELCNSIKQLLPNKKYIIKGQVNQPKLSHGHLYLNLKDSSSLIKAIIWKTKLENIIINEGDEITVQGKLDLYIYNGSISFIVDKIVENDGIGELQKKYELIKKEFEVKGYFNDNIKIKLPNVIKKILIITSKTGAAIFDFLHNIKNYKSKLEYEILDVPVQGTECPKLICQHLDEFDGEYDLIIITRGGGSFQDLFGFSQPELIESVYNFKKYNIPILSAIGHQVDVPLLDSVADLNCATPSLASQFIINHNKDYLNNFEIIKKNVKDDIFKLIYTNQKKILDCKNLLLAKFNDILKIKKDFRDIIYNDLVHKKVELNYMLKGLENDNIILFDLNNNKIDNSDDIELNTKYILLWKNKKYKIKIYNDI